MAAVAAAQLQEAVREDAALQERVERVLEDRIFKRSFSFPLAP